MADEIPEDLAAEVGNKFDPEEHKAAGKAMTDLKKQNFRTVFGGGKGRVAIFVVVLVFLTLVIFSVSTLYSRGKANRLRQAAAQTNADNAVLPPPSVVDGDNTMVTSDDEVRMRAQANSETAKNARANGEAYLAPPVLKDDSHQPQTNGKDDMAAAKPTEANERSARDRLSGVGAAPAPVVENTQAFQEELRQLREFRERIQREQIQPQIFAAMGRDSEGKPLPVFATSTYQVPDRNAAAKNAATAPSATVSSPSASAVMCTSPDIHAGTTVYGTLSYGMNSEDGSKFAIGVIQSGPYAGSKVIGQPQFTDKNVSATFERISVPGRASVAIKAVAIDEVTGRGGIADDVDSHVLARYSQLFVAALATGIGKAASMTTGSTTTTSTTTTVVDTTPMTSQREAKIALGEVGTAFGEDLKRRSDQLKPTITTNPNKGVGFVFLEDVCLNSSAKR